MTYIRRVNPRRFSAGLPRLLPLCLILAACAGTPAADSVTSLSATAWRLESIQSMEDAQGTTLIPESQRYTVSFGADGRAALQLDCNRGSGPWQAEAAGPASGSLSFGMLAVTRAMCPPGSLDSRVTRDLGHVRGYLLKDGKLFMSLMADGGIYQWVPLERK